MFFNPISYNTGSLSSFYFECSQSYVQYQHMGIPVKKTLKELYKIVSNNGVPEYILKVPNHQSGRTNNVFL